jgi:hypothetical protein
VKIETWRIAATNSTTAALTPSTPFTAAWSR